MLTLATVEVHNAVEAARVVGAHARRQHSPQFYFDGFALVTLPARQMMGRSLLARLAALPALAAACATAFRQLAGTDLVVSDGGYASVPAVVAAALRRLPLALVEPNAVPGRANRLGARFARLVFVGFDAAASAFPPERTSISGIPLRQALVDWDGPVTLEAYTVAHQKGVPRIGHAACLIDDGRRTWACTDEPGVLEAMMREEFCGRPARVDGHGRLSVD